MVPLSDVTPGPQGQSLQRCFSVFLNMLGKGVLSVSHHGTQLGDGFAHAHDKIQYNIYFSLNHWLSFSMSCHESLASQSPKLPISQITSSCMS